MTRQRDCTANIYSTVLRHVCALVHINAAETLRECDRSEHDVDTAAAARCCIRREQVVQPRPNQATPDAHQAELALKQVRLVSQLPCALYRFAWLYVCKDPKAASGSHSANALYLLQQAR